jgi:hypothetical protein
MRPSPVVMNLPAMIYQSSLRRVSRRRAPFRFAYYAGLGDLELAPVSGP